MQIWIIFGRLQDYIDTHINIRLPTDEISNVSIYIPTYNINITKC